MPGQVKSEVKFHFSTKAMFLDASGDHLGDNDSSITSRSRVLLVIWNCSLTISCYIIIYYYYRLLGHKGSIKHIHRQNIHTAYKQAQKIIKSHQNHVSQTAAEIFSNTACFIMSIPSYEHRPHFERRSLHIFLFRYAKVFSTLLLQ